MLWSFLELIHMTYSFLPIDFPVPPSFLGLMGIACILYWKKKGGGLARSLYWGPCLAVLTSSRA